MAVIAVYSIKGGVGKTTLAFDLAWRAAQAGKRTLLWDLDLQGGAAYLLDEDEPQVPRAVSAFRPGGLLRQQVRKTRFERLFPLPAEESLRVLPNELARRRERHRLTGLTHLLSGEFRQIVLDCPPALNEVSDQIISAADLIVVPLPPSPLAMRALETVRKELAHNHADPPPVFPVLSMVDLRRKLHRDTVLGSGGHWPVVPLASAIEATALKRAPIDTFARGTKPARALADLFAQVEARIETLPSREAARLRVMLSPTPRSPFESVPEEPAAAPAAQGRSTRRKSGEYRENAAIRALRWLLRV